ncbi:hypothetical protein ABZ619_14405, partial [Streptomyces sp. NPDC007851]
MASESRDEVRQRINSLYDQAENATGNYNATRAMNGGSRSRGVPLFKRTRRDDPGLDNIAREWFEGARAKLGPSVPAALPSDRMPDRSGPRRPVSAMAADLLSQLEGSGPDRLALSAGPSGQSDVEVVRELPAERPKLELTAGPAPALEATPGARAAAVPQPAQEARNPWPLPEAQVPAQEWQTALGGIPAQRTDSGAVLGDALAATGVLPAMTATETGASPAVPATDTGSFRVMTPGAGTAQTMPPTADTGGYRVMTPGAQDLNPMTDSGAFRVMTPGADTAQAMSPMTDSGAFRVMSPGAQDTAQGLNP